LGAYNGDSVQWWEAVLLLIGAAMLLRILIHDHQYIRIESDEYCVWCGRKRKD